MNLGLIFWNIQDTSSFQFDQKAATLEAPKEQRRYHGHLQWLWDYAEKENIDLMLGGQVLKEQLLIKLHQDQRDKGRKIMATEGEALRYADMMTYRSLKRMHKLLFFDLASH